MVEHLPQDSWVACSSPGENKILRIDQSSCLINVRKKCSLEICTFFAHLLFLKEQLCDQTFCHTFEKCKEKCDHTIAILKKVTKKCNRTIALFKRATKKLNLTIALFKRATKKCNRTITFLKRMTKIAITQSHFLEEWQKVQSHFLNEPPKMAISHSHF